MLINSEETAAKVYFITVLEKKKGKKKWIHTIEIK